MTFALDGGKDFNVDGGNSFLYDMSGGLLSFAEVFDDHLDSAD